MSEFGIKASSKEQVTISVLTSSKLGKHSVRTRSWHRINSTLEDLVKLAMKSTEILQKVAHLRGKESAAELSSKGHLEYQYCEQVNYRL